MLVVTEVEGCGFDRSWLRKKWTADPWIEKDKMGMDAW